MPEPSDAAYCEAYRGHEFRATEDPRYMVCRSCGTQVQLGEVALPHLLAGLQDRTLNVVAWDHPDWLQLTKEVGHWAVSVSSSTSYQVNEDQMPEFHLLRSKLVLRLAGTLDDPDQLDLGLRGAMPENVLMSPRVARIWRMLNVPYFDSRHKYVCLKGPES